MCASGDAARRSADETPMAFNLRQRQLLFRDEGRARAPVRIAPDELGDEAHGRGLPIAAVLWRGEKAHVVEVGLGRLEAVDAQIGPRALLDEATSLWPVEYGELRDVGFDLPPPEYFAAEESVDLTLVLCDAGLVLRSHRKFGPFT
jgi:hypothetical protein